MQNIATKAWLKRMTQRFLSFNGNTYVSCVCTRFTQNVIILQIAWRIYELFWMVVGGGVDGCFTLSTSFLQFHFDDKNIIEHSNLKYTFIILIYIYIWQRPPFHFFLFSFFFFKRRKYFSDLLFTNKYNTHSHNILTSMFYIPHFL